MLMLLTQKVGDAYNQHFDAIIPDFKNKVKCVDDTCMWETQLKLHFSRHVHGLIHRALLG